MHRFFSILAAAPLLLAAPEPALAQAPGVTLGVDTRYAHLELRFPYEASRPSPVWHHRSKSRSYRPAPRFRRALRSFPVQRKVWVPATERQVWVEPIVAKRYDACGRAYLVEVSPGYWRTVVEPGHWEVRVHASSRPVYR